MTYGMKTLISAIIAIFMFIVIAFSISFFTGCKPEMPVRSDYQDNLPCYLADRCITINAYMVNNKTDCNLALQKCYRYIDWEKCKKEDDFKNCWNELGIRL